MDKELDKLEKLSGSGKGKAPPIQSTLDAVLLALQTTKARLASEPVSSESYSQLSQTIEQRKKDIDERLKEIYSSLSRYGKALDKKFPASLPDYGPLFTSPESVAAMNNTVALHLLRTGQFETTETFLKEAGGVIPPDVRSQFANLHRILFALRSADIGPAVEWVSHNYVFLDTRSSPLAFSLHRSHYVRMLLAATTQTDIMAAVGYAQTQLRPYYDNHRDEFNRLMSAVIYAPEAKLRTSPYSDLTLPNIHTDLEAMFTRDYCASLDMNHHAPLRVVADIGGNGALARIEKGIKVMKDRKSEWSQTGELPIEVPLGPEHRYHSIFACPVSKEQATEHNPPMMLTCGHVITKESLQKVNRDAGRMKCPYCPVVSVIKDCVRVYF